MEELLNTDWGLEGQDDALQAESSSAFNTSDAQAQPDDSLASMLEITAEQGRTTIDPNLLSNTGRGKRKLDALVPPTSVSDPTSVRSRRMDSVDGEDESIESTSSRALPKLASKPRCQRCADRNLRCDYPRPSLWTRKNPCFECRNAKIFCIPS